MRSEENESELYANVLYIYYAHDRSAVYNMLIVHIIGGKCTIKMLRICNILIVHIIGGKCTIKMLRAILTGAVN